MEMLHLWWQNQLWIYVHLFRSMMGPGGRTTPSGSRDTSRDSSRNRQQSRERPGEFKEPAPPAIPKELTEAEVEKKTKAIMEEYLHIQDMKVKQSSILHNSWNFRSCGHSRWYENSPCSESESLIHRLF